MGVQQGHQAVAFGEYVRELDGVGLHGILGHDAHLPFVAEDGAELERLCAETADRLGSTAARLEDEVGDCIEFIVPNAYGPVALHDTLPVLRDGEVRDLWNIEARGKDK